MRVQASAASRLKLGVVVLGRVRDSYGLATVATPKSRLDKALVGELDKANEDFIKAQSLGYKPGEHTPVE